ncbi:hypothetical protein I4U23_022523 [Adineta vaga]|nr:hypothetical protein I4U23_022523 [Adineta vaga]
MLWMMKIFFNKWFHRSLKFSQQSPRNNPRTSNGGHRQGLTQDFNRSLFPPNLQSSECHFLQVIDPFYVAGNQYFFEQNYPSSLFRGYYSFSFWIFLPCQCELAVQVGMDCVLDLHSCSHADQQWRFVSDAKTLVDDQWIHIVTDMIIEK